jgi:hypothetical protein
MEKETYEFIIEALIEKLKVEVWKREEAEKKVAELLAERTERENRKFGKECI